MARVKRIKEWRGVPVWYSDPHWIQTRRKGHCIVGEAQVRINSAGTDYWCARMCTPSGPPATGFSTGLHKTPDAALDEAFERMAAKLRGDLHDCVKRAGEITDTLANLEQYGPAF